MGSGSGIDGNRRRSIMRFANYTCAACGIVGREVKRRKQGYGYHTDIAGVYLSIDHIKPKSKGGTDDPMNLRVLCTTCNSAKGTKDHWPSDMDGFGDALVMGAFARGR